MCGDIKRSVIRPRQTEHAKFSTSIKWLFVNVILALPFYAFAQLYQNERLEIPISADEESFDVACADQGIVLHREVSVNDAAHLEVVYLDTALHEKWQGFLPVDPALSLSKQKVIDGQLYLLFSDRSLYTRGFHLYRINLQQGNFGRYVVRNSIPFIPIELEVTAAGALIGGYFNRVPLVLFFEFSSQQSKILPGLFNEAGELTDININSDETFDVLVCARNYQRQQTLWVKNYDRTGKLLRNTMLLPEGDNHLIFGRTIQTENNTQLIAGVYGNKTGEFSRGLFIANLNRDGVQKIQYYNFGDLENFFKYMKANQEKRVKNRIQRKKIKGKRIKFQYRFIVHELVPYKNQFILSGEAFYKRYKTISTSSPMDGTAGQIFDGYQYTHAAVLGIGDNGKLLWDNSFEINDVRTFTLEQFVKMDAKKNEIALLYLFDNKIRTKIIRDSTVLEGKSFSPLQLKENEKLIPGNRASINKLEYWFNTYFLAYGVQNIASQTNRKKKKVFFLSKISYK